MILAGLVQSAVGFWICNRLLAILAGGGTVELCDAARLDLAVDHAHPDRILPIVGAAGELVQPSPRAAVQSLCAGADRAEGRVLKRLPQVGADRQGRSGAASAGSLSLPQSPADCRALAMAEERLGRNSGRHRSVTPLARAAWPRIIHGPRDRGAGCAIVTRSVSEARPVEPPSLTLRPFDRGVINPGGWPPGCSVGCPSSPGAFDSKPPLQRGYVSWVALLPPATSNPPRPDSATARNTSVEELGTGNQRTLLTPPLTMPKSSTPSAPMCSAARQIRGNRNSWAAWKTEAVVDDVDHTRACSCRIA